MTVIFHGFNTHPGYAKGRMVNAIKVAADFIARLPPDRLSPETTDGREGLVHPYVVQAGVDQTSVRLLIRDFERKGLTDKETYIEALARTVAGQHRGARVEVTIEESYRNMREVLESRPEVAGYAAEAVRRAGLEVRTKSIRGGTDGSRLSFMGLPTPNVRSTSSSISAGVGRTELTVASGVSRDGRDKIASDGRHDPFARAAPALREFARGAVRSTSG